MAWGGIIIGVGVSILGVLCVAIATRKPDPEEQRRNAEAIAAAEDAAAQRQAALENDWRKGCKLKSTAAVFVVTDDALRDRCHDMIRESLKVPGSGDFPSSREDSQHLTSDDGCNRIYTSYVDAKNAFGVKIRTRYECVFDPRTGLYSTKSLN